MIDAISIERNGFADIKYEERDNLHKYLLNAPIKLKEHWKFQQKIYNKEDDYELESHEWDREWKILLSLASKEFKEGTTILNGLESFHLFALANIYKQPIIVIADEFHFHNRRMRWSGIYLPLLHKPQECDKNSLIIAYNQAHFTAMVAMPGCTPLLCPITNHKGKLLAIPFSSAKTLMSKKQKIALIKMYLIATTINENGTFMCVRHALSTTLNERSLSNWKIPKLGKVF